jgi:uncharacterized membrane protein
MQKKTTRYRSVFIAAFLGILVASTLLKVSFTSAKEFWLDETYSSFLVSHPFSQMMIYIKGDVHPPLYYIILKGWSVIFGISPFSLQSCSIFASVIASLLFFYLVTKTITHRIVQLFCFSLFQFSPVLFWYSVEVRMYMFAIIFIILSLLYYKATISQDSSKKRNIFLFSLFSACAFYTHYSAAFFILGYCMHLLLLAIKKQIRFKTAFVPALLILMMIIPWFPTVYQQAMNKTKLNHNLLAARLDPNTLSFSPNEARTKSFLFDVKNIVEDIASILGVYPESNRAFGLILALPFFVIIIYSLFLLAKRNQLAILAYGMSIIYIVAGLLFQVSSRRYFIFLTPLLILVIGISVHDMTNRNKFKLLSVVIGLSILTYYVLGVGRIYYKSYRKPTTDIVNYLSKHYRAGDIIVFNSLYYQIPFDYYASLLHFYPTKRGFPTGISEWWDKQPFKGWGGPIITKHMLTEFVESLGHGNHKRSVWLILFETNYYDTHNQLFAKLKSISRSIEKQHTGTRDQRNGQDSGAPVLYWINI